jgi:hypothetical protein
MNILSIDDAKIETASVEHVTIISNLEKTY